MGFSRRGRCPHLPLKICQWPYFSLNLKILQSSEERHN
jgi:hypothetical protein